MNILEFLCRKNSTQFLVPLETHECEHFCIHGRIWEIYEGAFIFVHMKKLFELLDVSSFCNNKQNYRKI